MSGICGIVALDGRPSDPEAIAAMAAAAGYRGRDGTQARCEGPVGMAHLMLHVTGDEPHDPQPLHDADLWIVADARIDNADDLRSSLVGHQGPKVPATGLLLAAYRRWGDHCVDHLLGDYAFVVWDGRSGRVFAARDPAGVRSLHYRAEPARFVFGTDVKQVLAAPGVPVALYEPAVAGYLAGGYGRPGWTFYDGVAELPPGHLLQVSTGGVRVRRFWDPTPTRTVRYVRQAEYAEHFRELLTEAVRCRTRSCRPVGILLSGGVDSGSIASMAGHLLRQASIAPSLRSYSFAFDELTDCDERHVSRPIVEAYDLADTAVSGDDAWPLSGYPDHGPDRDSPFTWVYARLLERCASIARHDGVGVLLTGEGGDELLGDEILDLAGQARALRIPSLLRELRGLATRRGTSVRRVIRRELLAPLRRAMADVPGLRARRRRLPPEGTDASRPWVQDDLFRRTGIADLVRDDPRQRWHDLSPVERRVIRLSSPHLPRLLSWQERLHAQAGVGAAMPLADLRLVQYVVSVPQWAVNSPTEPKRLARRALAGIMPEETRRAAHKVVPAALYHRGMSDRGVPVLKDLLSAREMVARGFAHRGVLQRQLEIHLSGGSPSYDLWWAVTLEWWLRSFWSTE